MFGLAALVLAATAAFQAQALLADCDRNATVALGDTCDIISAKYNASTYQLAASNPGLDCTHLVAGQVLCLGIKCHDCMTTCVVQPQDTCFDIALRHNIPLETLYKNNPNINENCTNIYPGEVLCVSDKIYVNSTQPA